MAIVVLSIALSIAASAQTKTATSSPVPPDSLGSGGPPGGPTGLFTIYDGQTLRKGEFTFSVAYSNFDRDPGKIDITDWPGSFNVGLTDHIELFFKTNAYRGIRVNNPQKLSSFYLPSILPRTVVATATMPCTILTRNCRPPGSWDPLSPIIMPTTAAPSYLLDAPFVNRLYGESSFTNFVGGAKIRLTNPRNAFGIGFIPFYRWYPDDGGHASGFNQLQRGTSPGGDIGDLGLLTFVDGRLSQSLNQSGNLGYILNSNPKYPNGIVLDRADEIIAGIGFDFPINRYVQPIVALRSTQYVGGRTPNAFPNNPVEHLAGSKLYPARWFGFGASLNRQLAKDLNGVEANSMVATSAGVPQGFQPSSDPHGFGAQLWAGHPNRREPAILPNHPPVVSSFAASASTITLPCPSGSQAKSAIDPPSSTSTVTLTTKATDPDDDTLLYSYSVTGGRITGEDASVTWDLSGMTPGTYSATVDVDDGCGCITSATTTVTIVDCRANASDNAAIYEKAGSDDYSQNDYRTALAHYEQALSIYKGLRDQKGEVRILTNIGVTYRALGESVLALDSFNEALSISTNAGEDVDDTLLLYNIGLAKLNSGAAAQALSYFQKAMLRIRASRTTNEAHRELEGLTLNGMGSIYASLGETAEALNYYHQALEIFEQSHDHLNQAIALNNIGKLHNMLGAYDDALDYYDRALVTIRAIVDRKREADLLYDIGNVYFNKHDVARAAERYQASLYLFRSIKDQAGESLSLTGLGRTYAASKDFKNALDSFNSARTIAEAIGNRRSAATAFAEIGKIYRIQGNGPNALENYGRALKLTSELGDKNGEAATLYEIASLSRDFGNLEKSREFIERAISAVESQRATVPGSELRSTYSASIQKFYGFYIDLLVTLNTRQPSDGFDGLAFQASEQARARTLLDSLIEARADVNEVDPVLLERERSARQTLNDVANKQTRLLTKPHNEKEAEAVAKEVDTSFREYQEAQSILRSKNPRYAALEQAKPSSLKEVQEQLLDENTLLLSYVLGDARSFVFAVSRDSISTYVLPGRAEIEVTALSVYNSVAKSHESVQDNGSARKTATPVDSERSFESVNRRLSQILINPVSKNLGNKRLLIVAPGALQKVPFAALFATDDRPLVLDHEIVSLPSASTLAILRTESYGRKSPPKAVAVIADPVLTTSDGRIERATSVKESTEEPGQKAADYSFPRLLSTRWEAQQIAALVPRSESLLATDFDANREVAMSAELSQYRIVHFATHGINNEQYPDLSGIILSLVDREGHPQDGFLRLNEISQMKLPVDLVVLSGCSTGIGKDIRGEGLINLTRGFMYAGAPRVVFSLWPVDDRATAELMVRFYRKMLVEKLPAAAALRATQIEMWKDSRWNSPYFWAPFVFQGEYR